VRLVEDLAGHERAVVGIVSQRDAEVDEPRFEDLYQVGTVARVVKVLRLGPNNYSVVLHGLARFQIAQQVALEPYMRARVRRIPEDLERDVEIDALGASLREGMRHLLSLMPNARA
jgi:ATP-dependent Lon protease